MPNAPSGPRGPHRTPLNTVPLSPVSRGPPTGPAAGADRGGRNGGNPLRTINSVLTQNSPNDRPPERSTPQQAAQVRGRGASRVNGAMDAPGETTSPMLPPQALTPNARGDGQYSRSNRPETPLARVEGVQMEDQRSEPRGHREGRRSERPGHERSSDRSDRRPEERNNRNGLSQAEQERGSERERGREKRDREGGRRERERDGERANRESDRPDRSGREPRESSRRERGPREDGRPSGREDRDRRSRGGGGVGGPGVPGVPSDDGRKRGRDPMDQSQGHPDPKRRR